MNEVDDLLATLADHPGWQVLEQKAEERQRQRVEGLANKLLAGEDLDLRQIDMERGERAGAQWLLRQPELARKRLEKDRVS